jgi:hypothetical protein
MRSPVNIGAISVLGLFAVILGACFVYFPSFGLNPIWGVAIIVGFIGASFLGVKPRTFFWLFLVWAWISKLIEGIVSFSQYTDELMSLLWIVVLGGGFAFHRNQKPAAWFFRLMIGLFFICVASTLINGSSPKKAILFFFSYIFPIVSFYLVRNYLGSGKNIRLFVKVMAGVFLLQVVLNLGWLFKINPLPNNWLYTHDFAIGSMRSQTHVAYLCCFILISLMVAYFQFRSSRMRIGLVLVAIVVMGQFVMTYTMHAYVFIGIGVGVYLLLFSGKRIWVLLPSSLFVIIFLLFLSAQISSKEKFVATSGQNLREEMRPENIQRRWDMMVSGPKGECYGDAFLRAPTEKPIRWFVGAGPGNFLSGIAMTKPPFSELTLRYLGKYFLTHSGSESLRGGSITSNVTSTPSVLMGELGVLGLFCYAGLYFMVVWIVLKNIHRGAYQDGLQLVLAKSFVCAVVMFVFMNLLVDLAQTDRFTVTLWAWAGFLIEPLKVEHASARVDGLGSEV